MKGYEMPPLKTCCGAKLLHRKPVILS